MSRWYDAPETNEERQARTDRYGNPMREAPTPFSRIIDRAYAIIRPEMRRPPRGIAVPFGIEHRDSLKWRVSPDVFFVLASEPPSRQPALSPLMETLFGVRIDRDFDAPEGTLELDAEATGRGSERIAATR